MGFRDAKNKARDQQAAREAVQRFGESNKGNYRERKAELDKAAKRIGKSGDQVYEDYTGHSAKGVLKKFLGG